MGQRNTQRYCQVLSKYLSLSSQRRRQILQKAVMQCVEHCGVSIISDSIRWDRTQSRITTSSLMDVACCGMMMTVKKPLLIDECTFSLSHSSESCQTRHFCPCERHLLSAERKTQFHISLSEQNPKLAAFGRDVKVDFLWVCFSAHTRFFGHCLFILSVTRGKKLQGFTFPNISFTTKHSCQAQWPNQKYLWNVEGKGNLIIILQHVALRTVPTFPFCSSRTQSMHIVFSIHVLSFHPFSFFLILGWKRREQNDCSAPGQIDCMISCQGASQFVSQSLIDMSVCFGEIDIPARHTNAKRSFQITDRILPAKEPARTSIKGHYLKHCCM